METLRVCVCGVSSQLSFPITLSPGAEMGLCCLRSREGIGFNSTFPFTHAVLLFSIQCPVVSDCLERTAAGGAIEMVPFVTVPSL